MAAAAEAPPPALEGPDRHIKRSEELIAACREYLRTARAKVENLGK